MTPKIRNVLFTLCGAAGLLFKGHYTGLYQSIVRAYLGNISVSFAVYFLLANLPIYNNRCGRLLVAAFALTAVCLFEATDGFHLMANTYDPWDYAANAAGIALALLADELSYPHGLDSRQVL